MQRHISSLPPFPLCWYRRHLFSFSRLQEPSRVKRKREKAKRLYLFCRSVLLHNRKWLEAVAKKSRKNLPRRFYILLVERREIFQQKYLSFVLRPALPLSNASPSPSFGPFLRVLLWDPPSPPPPHHHLSRAVGRGERGDSFSKKVRREGRRFPRSHTHELPHFPPCPTLKDGQSGRGRGGGGLDSGVLSRLRQRWRE